MRVPLLGGTLQEIAKANFINNHQCSRAPANLCMYSVVSDHDITFFTYDPMKGPIAQVYQIKDDVTAQLYNWSLPDGTTLAIAKGKWGEKKPAFTWSVSTEVRSDGSILMSGTVWIPSTGAPIARDSGLHPAAEEKMRCSTSTCRAMSAWCGVPEN